MKRAKKVFEPTQLLLMVSVLIVVCSGRGIPAVSSAAHTTTSSITSSPDTVNSPKFEHHLSSLSTHTGPQFAPELSPDLVSRSMCYSPESFKQQDETSTFIDTLKVYYATNRADFALNTTVLSWDPALAADAHRAANNCAIVHYGEGQNVKAAIYTLWKAGGPPKDFPELTRLAIQYWDDWKADLSDSFAADGFWAALDPDIDSFGCAWSDLSQCQTYTMYCFFRNATCPIGAGSQLPPMIEDPGASSVAPQPSERDLIVRDQTVNRASKAAWDQTDCTSTTRWKCIIQFWFYTQRTQKNINPELNWSDSLSKKAFLDAQSCVFKKTAPHPAQELAFMEHLQNQSNVDVSVAWDAVHFWEKNSSTHPQPEASVFYNSSMRYVGCGFAKCGSESYSFNCVLSPWGTIQKGKRNDSYAVKEPPRFNLNNEIGNFFATLRSDQGLNSHVADMRQSADLRYETFNNTSCNATIMQKPNEIWSETNSSCISNKTYPWPEIMQAAQLRRYSSRFASALESPPETEYALIVDPEMKCFFCTWSECYSGIETYRIVCAFSDTGKSDDIATRATNLALRETIQPLDLVSAAKEVFSLFRRYAGLPVDQQNLTYSWTLQLQAQGDVSKCDSVIEHPEYETYYEVLTSTFTDKTHLWFDMFNQADFAWFNSRKTNNEDGSPTAFQIITNASWVSYGCAWSPLCHPHTEEESYQLYCAFSKDKPLGTRDEHSI